MTVHALGLMSGTSLDGLDICHASFRKADTGVWTYILHSACTFPYENEMAEQLRNAVNLAAEDLFTLNASYGFYLGEKTEEFIRRFSVENIDVIASHGHTVFHQPQRSFTIQIGDGRALNAVTGLPVIYDFRSQVVLLGGNGAPLVPIGDELLFSDYGACLNIGGFSNISFKKDGRRTAFDICPVNIVLNHCAQMLGYPFDKDGKSARAGKVLPELIAELNRLDYYAQCPPKSLGLEWVKENIFPKIKDRDPVDLLATFTEHAAEQISETLNRYCLQKVLFTGGGTHNSYLTELIRKKTSVEIIIPDEKIINFKEALIFAFMGVLKLNNENNVLSSATGSRHDHSAGLIVK